MYKGEFEFKWQESIEELLAEKIYRRIKYEFIDSVKGKSRIWVKTDLR